MAITKKPFQPNKHENYIYNFNNKNDFNSKKYINSIRKIQKPIENFLQKYLKSINR